MRATADVNRTFGLNVAEALGSIARVRNESQGPFEGRVSLILDDGGIEALLAEIRAPIEIPVSLITADIEDAASQVADLGQTVEVAVDIPTGEIDTASDQIGNLSQTVEIGVDILSSDIEAVGQQIGNLSQTVEVGVDILSSDIDAVGQQIGNLSQQVEVGVNVVAGEIGDVASAIANLNQTVEVLVDVNDSQLAALDASLAATRTSAAGLGAGIVSQLSPQKLGLTTVAAGFGSLIVEAQQAEAGIREVASLQIPGFGLEEANDLMARFNNETGLGLTNNIPALYQALSAGIPPDNAFDFLVTSSQLAGAGVAELGPTVGVLTSALNAYAEEGLSAGDASNALFGAVQSGVTTLPELSRQLGQISPLAAEMGVNFTDLNAAVATSTQVTGRTNISVTGLRQVLSELNNPTTRVSQAFQELAGQTFPEFIREGNSLGEGLLFLQEGSEQLGVGLSELFGSNEAVLTSLQLTREGGEAYASTLSSMNDIVAEGTAVATGFEINQAGLGEVLDQVRNRVQGVAIELGNQLLPSLTSAALFIATTVIPAVGEFFQTLIAGQGPIGEFAASLGDLAQSVGPALFDTLGNVAAVVLPALAAVSTAISAAADFTTFLADIGLLEPILTGLAAVIGFMAATAIPGIIAATLAWTVSSAGLVTTQIALAAAVVAANAPLIAIGAAIAAVVAGVVFAYREFETFRNVVNTVRDVILNFGGVVLAALGLAFDGVVAGGQALVGFFQGPLGAAFQFVVDVGQTIVEFLGGALLSAFDTVVAGGQAFVEFLSGALGGAFDFIVAAGVAIIQFLATDLLAAFDTVVSVGAGFVDFLSGGVIAAFDLFGAGVDLVLVGFNALVDLIETILGPAFEILGETGAEAAQVYRDDIAPAVDAARAALEFIADIVSTVLTPAFDLLVENATTVVAFIRGDFVPVFEAIVGAAGAVADFFIGPLAAAFNAVQAVAGFLRDLLGGPLTAAFNIVVDVVQFLAGLYLGLLTTAFNVVIGVAQFLAGLYTGLVAAAFRVVIDVAQFLGGLFGGFLLAAFNIVISIATTLGGLLLGPMRAAFDAVIFIATTLATLFATQVALAFRLIVTVATAVASNFSGQLSAAFRGVQAVASALAAFYNGVLAPAFRVIVAVATLVANALRGPLSSAISSALAIGRTFAAFLVGSLQASLNRVRSAITSAAGAFSGAFTSAIGSARSAVEGLIGVIQRVIDAAGRIGSVVGGAVSSAQNALSSIPFVGGAVSSIISAVPLARGAVVTGPTNALIGEAGAEIVAPLTDMSRTVDLFRQSGEMGRLVDALVRGGEFNRIIQANFALDTVPAMADAAVPAMAEPSAATAPIIVNSEVTLQVPEGMNSFASIQMLADQMAKANEQSMVAAAQRRREQMGLRS